MPCKNSRYTVTTQSSVYPASVSKVSLPHHSCTSGTIHWYHCIQWTVCCFLRQYVNEFSEGLLWASEEGCLEDVVFLLSTGVEVNSRGQVRFCNVCSTCQTKVQLLSHTCCIFTCGTCCPVTHVLPAYSTIQSTFVRFVIDSRGI